MSGRVWYGIVAISLARACGTEEPTPTARLGGEVVAVVDREPIRRSEIAATARAYRISAREALNELENRALLASYASRRGLDSGSRESLRRRALVQTLLDRVERQNPPSAVTEADIAPRREAARRSLTVPRTRVVTHLLVRLADAASPDEVEAASRIAHEALAAALESRALSLESIRERSIAERPGVEISVERLPRFDETAAYDADFIRAAFSIGEGLVPEVVRTSYGFHVLRVDVADEGHVPTDDEVRDAAIAAVVTERRAAATGAIVTAERDRVRLEYREATVARLLGDDALFEGVR